MNVETQDAEILRDAVDQNQGILIAPNHSVHYDAPALYLAADEVDVPLFFMTAWQVFAMSSTFERHAMQRLGCFSVDREGNDRRAFKLAVQTLQTAPHPLVIFPEGDIYHTTDIVTPFRDGAAAIALAATKRSERPVVVVPCGIKFWYLNDPREELNSAMKQIESRLFLRPDPALTIVHRVHRLAEAALALKELDYLGHTREGRLRDRVVFLTEAVLVELEERHSISKANDTPPERVKTLRQTVIRKLAVNGEASTNDDVDESRLFADMEDLFFVMQLFSYRGDYLVGQPSLERVAETVDKFEEDILEQDYPTVRGRRRAVVRFGEPIRVERKGVRGEVEELSRQMQTRVQELIDSLNAAQG
jgi:hypothetical protein